MSPARKRRRASAPSAEPARKPTAEDAKLSPAERMAAFRADQEERATERAKWVDTLPFVPDAFQIEAMDALESGQSVLVAAPTGAGKTVVGEFATHLAQRAGRRAFYTTPIKALSNQKFLDLSRQFGEAKVGLLTGDVSINPAAPVVVMTTEVLRNMIYAGADLSDLSHVVLDEVHYLADRMRGPVWEEVIIHAPAHVHLVALSATVSNAEEFGAWIQEVRGSCAIIVSEQRPVPLYQHMMVGTRLYDLYAPSRRGGGPSARLNPELLEAVKTIGLPRGIEDSRGRDRFSRLREERRAAVRETRPSTLVALDRAHLLPAIIFVFSRQGCEDAVEQVLRSGMVLTSRSEAAQIAAYLDEVVDRIDPRDHGVLGVDSWVQAVERGVAAHHAGLLPLMKEAVEHLFAKGLVKVVYATETLALGINMPARSVVIESLVKWNGAAHVQLSAGEYTQLSGRAGRRGIDTEGHAVVLHRGRVAPEEISALASKRTYPLVSAFRPTYNMVVNLLSHSSRAATREVLETSYAQFQADGAVVHLARQLRTAQALLEEAASAMACEQGDAAKYFALREDVARLQKEGARQRVAAGKDSARRELAGVRLGDVIRYQRGRRVNHAVVGEVGRTAQAQVAVRAIGTDGRWHHVGEEDLAGWVGVVGHIDLVAPHRLRTNRERIRVGDELRELVRSGTLDVPRRRPKPPFEPGAARVEELERQLRAHPVHRCDHRDEHAVAGHEWARRRREVDRLLAMIDGRTSSVAKEFDRVCQVLDTLGFLSGDAVTQAGQMLTHVFGERDLVVVEALRGGVWKGLDAAETAALASCFVYEARGDSEGAPTAAPVDLSATLARRWEGALEAHARVAAAETAAGARLSPPPEPGIMSATAAWARGASLTTALSECELSGGDFVRWMRQVMDLLEQLRRLGDEDLARRSRAAREALAHGVVAWSAL